MSDAVAERKEAPPASFVFPGAGDLLLYAGAIVCGSILIVIAAISQPFNQNELKQMKPYDGTSLSEITSGTRQPPLDPLLGSLLQHLLGEGQIRQRLVPVLAGIGSLLLMALLLRRLGLGRAGAFGVWVMATAPLMVRYSAYSRPYALPLFLMMLFVFAAQRWLDDAAKRWLVLAALAAVALPLARVPEPTLLLLATAATMAWFAIRGRFTWSQAGPLFAIAVAALALVGYPMYRSLASKTETLWDPSLSGVIGRFGSSAHELITGFLPLLASWFPWWPITLLVIVAAFAIPDARRRLLQWWFVWPLLAGPAIFMFAYHFLNPVVDTLSYRARMLIFFVPGYALMVVALASTVAGPGTGSRRVRVGFGTLLAAALIGQLPSTGRVLVENEAPDFVLAGEVLTRDLPADAVVLYDMASPIGRWHQPFTAKARYMGDKPFVGPVSSVVTKPKSVPQDGPVYVLFLDSECATTVVCDEPPAAWDGAVPGWQVVQDFDKFTLYQPDEPLTGRAGAIEALRDFAASLGPGYGSGETFAAAALLNLAGQPEKGRRLIREMYAEASPEEAQSIREYAEEQHLNPFR